MAFYVYILQSKTTGRYYVGHSADVSRRLSEHNRGHTTSLRGRGPWEVILTEEFPTRSAAAAREREIKRMKSRQWVEQLVRASR